MQEADESNRINNALHHKTKILEDENMQLKTKISNALKQFETNVELHSIFSEFQISKSEVNS